MTADVLVLMRFDVRIALFLGCLFAAICVGEDRVYFEPQHREEELQLHVDVSYGQKVAQAGRGTTLLIYIFQPPSATAESPKALVVLIHGGGFQGGTKEKHHDWAREHASHGFVAACISYRLTTRGLRDSPPENFIEAATHATEDGMGAIRFLKKNATKYGIDPQRTVTIGMSAGGWISGFNAIDYDSFNHTKNSYPGVSSKVHAAIPMGVSYANGPIHRSMRDELMHFDADDTPVLLFHAEGTDKVTTAPWSEAVHLQRLIQNSGNVAELHPQPGDRHVDDMSPSGPHWVHISRFLKTHLSL